MSDLQPLVEFPDMLGIGITLPGVRLGWTPSEAPDTDRPEELGRSVIVLERMMRRDMAPDVRQRAKDAVRPLIPHLVRHFGRIACGTPTWRLRGKECGRVRWLLPRRETQGWANVGLNLLAQHMATDVRAHLRPEHADPSMQHPSTILVTFERGRPDDHSTYRWARLLLDATRHP